MDADALRTLELIDRSGRRYPLDDPRWRGDDGSPLMLSPIRLDTAAGTAVRALIDTAERSLWRYAAMLPVPAEHRISLGEGWTPLIADRRAGRGIHVKLEWFNPTSSFKDRGVAVMMSHLASRGATRVLEDSSGNGGSSVAAYAAGAGIAAKIIVPAATSPAKILQARAYGAEIELVGGTRDEVGDEAVRQSAEIPYASHNWHPLFLQGVKTIGYEIWEQLGFRAPDNIVTVAGSGSIVLGCDLAFGELRDAGAIYTVPRLLVGQPVDWATIVEAVNGVVRDPDRPRVPTIAEGSSIARPVRLPEVVAAIERSHGAAVAVTDDEIHAALRGLAARGLYAEPTSAVAAAALARFLADGTIRDGQTTVVILTGTALKAADRTAEVFAAAG